MNNPFWRFAADANLTPQSTGRRAGAYTLLCFLGEIFARENAVCDRDYRAFVLATLRETTGSSDYLDWLASLKPETDQLAAIFRDDNLTTDSQGFASALYVVTKLAARVYRDGHEITGSPYQAVLRLIEGECGPCEFVEKLRERWHGL